MTRTVAVPAVVAAIIAAGALNGTVGGRWAPLAADTALDGALPRQLPSWAPRPTDTAAELLIPLKAGESARAMAHYTHRTSGVNVSVLLVLGEAGPMAYNPLICYDGNGYSRVGPQRRRAVPDAPDQFWEADLGKRTLENYLRVRWAWGDGAVWQAPDNPRTEYLLKRELYKLYVVSAADPKQDADADPTVPFLAEFAAALRPALSPGSAPPPRE